ncbi:MAG: SDR family NAD(P)-dependent oxidoreductase [Candidatus Paceibacterota bacterium]
MRLENKVAIITGAGSGIGRATAILFAKEGAKVVVNDEHEDEANETVAMIKNEKAEAEAIPYRADVSIEEEVKAMTEKTLEEFGGIDILVNNAGIYRGHSVPETTKEEWDELFAVNIWGPFICAKYALQHMIERNSGKIINVSSFGGLVGMEGSAPYNATKGAVVNFTRGLAMECAPKGINVNCICPGWTKTPMVQALVDDPDMSQALLADIPYGKFAEPEDQANVLLWLASEESNNVHGSIIPNDGGWLVR